MGTPTPDTASSLLREARVFVGREQALYLLARIDAYLAAPAGVAYRQARDALHALVTFAYESGFHELGYDVEQAVLDGARAEGRALSAPATSPAEQQQAAARAEEEVTRWRAAGREALAVLDSNFVNIEVDTRATADRLTRALDALRLLLTPEAAPPSATPTDAGVKNDR